MLCFLPLQLCKLLEDRPQASVLIDQDRDDVVEEDECVQKRQAKLQKVRPDSGTGGDFEVLGVQGVCKLCEATYSPSRIHTSILHHRSAWAMNKHHALSKPLHSHMACALPMLVVQTTRGHTLALHSRIDVCHLQPRLGTVHIKAGLSSG